MAQRFTLALDDNAQIAFNRDEVGKVIARAQYANSQNQYLMEYRNGQGVAVEQWWGQSQLVKVEG